MATSKNNKNNHGKLKHEGGMKKLTKHLRLQLDFTIDIDESQIPTEGVHARPNGIERSGDDEAWREGDECNRRLLLAVLANKETFEAYLTYAIVTELDSMAWQDWHTLLLDSPDDDLEEVLAPAIHTLNAADQALFASAQENEVFFENTQEFQDCFTTILDHASIVEMEEEA